MSVATAKDPKQSSTLQSVITAVAVIAALHFGKELIVPFALALLLSFLLSQPVTWLEKLRLRRPFAVAFVLGVALSIAGGLIWLGIQELAGIATSLPQYKQNVVRKLEALRNPAGNSVLRVVQSMEQLKSQLTASQLRSEGKGNPNRPTTEVNPVPVHVVGGDGSSLLSSFGFAGASLVQIATGLLAVVILTLFMLLNREHIRNRAFRLFGQGRLVLMTSAIDDAAQRVSRYLLSQSLVNSSFGVLLFAGLYLIGVPYAAFWGVMAAVLRFVPYVGTFIAGLCPFLLSMAVFDGWHKPLLTFGLYAGIELSVSSVIEPWLYSTRTGISSLAILLSAAFWTLLWGPIGLVLSTPLTVCLAVLGRHLPPLEFLYVLLGDEPVLADEVRYYQRLLAEDEDEAAEVLETALKNGSLEFAYDSVIIPALALAERDRHEGRLPEHRASYIYQATRELIEVAGERHSEQTEHTEPSPIAVNCIAARDEADLVVGAMLVQLLHQRGVRADLIESPKDQMAHDRMLIVSALPPFAVIRGRTVCRRLRKAGTGHPIVLGVWASTAPAESIQERLGSGSADVVVTSLAEALEQVRTAAVPELADQAAR